MGIFKKVHEKPNLLDLADEGNCDGLIKVLFSEDEAEVDEATELLVKMGEKAIDPLIQQLGETSTLVQHTYAWGKLLEVSWPTSKPLVQLGKLAMDSLIQALKFHGGTGNYEKDIYDRNRRVGAALTLGLIRDKRAVQPLIESLENDPDPTGAAIALGMIGESQAVEPLLKKLSGETFFKRTTKVIIQALGNIGDKRAVEPLLEIALYPHHFNHADEVQKIYTAIEALADIRDERAVEPLIKLLSGKNSIFRWYSAIALGKIKDHRAVEPLIRALSDNKKLFRSGNVEYVCVKAAESLGEIGDNAAVDALIKVLSDKRKDLRIQAAIALGQIGDVKAIESLTQSLNDKELPVQEAVQAALEKINTAIK